MQGLADGYFVIPYTLGGYLASSKLAKVDTNHAAFKDAAKSVSEYTNKLLSIKASAAPAPSIKSWAP